MKKVAEPCMFCGFAPCECDGVKKVKMPAKRKPPKVSKSTAPVKDDVFDDVPVVAPTRFKSKVVERDLSLEHALRALYPICSASSQREIKKILHPPVPQELDRRLAEWRGRNGLEQER